MRDRRLSPEQAAAVLAPRGDLCVVAGAGSGKTRVLTERYVEHVRVHGVAVPRAAALTFTEKAARQMRTRIAAALAEEAEPSLLRELDAAPIATFHGFCSRLLRRNAVAAGVDPAFRVLDDAEAVLLDAEVRALVGARLAVDPQARGLLGALARLTDRDPLRGAAALLRRVRGAGLDPSVVRWCRGELTEERAVARAREALEVLREASARLEPRPAGLEDALRGVGVALGGGAPLPAARERLGAVALGGKGSQPAKSARSALVGALDDVEAARLDAEAEVRVWPGVQQVLGLLERAAADRKRALGVLDYDDLERETLRLLDRSAADGRRPEGVPEALLVDEHQDTNPVQEAILARLRALGATQFSVGDPRQSIYRFRRADVRVLTEELARVDAGARRTLVESYRAVPELVATLNGLFEQVFADGAAGVDHAPLAARGAFAPAAPGAGPQVEWALLDRGELPVEEGRRREAAWVAGWLRALVGTVARRRRGREAPLAWGDCAVLLRARDAMRFFEDAFSDAGIPYRVHKGRGFLQADEVGVLLHALRVVHNPHDADALAAFLRGPAFAARDDELLRWFGEGGGAGAWARLCADEEPRVRRLVEAVLDLRRRAAVEDLPRLVARTLERFGLPEAALLQPGGARRAANLRSLAGVAEEVSRAGHADVPAFLRYLDELRHLEVPQAEAPALVTGAGEVALLTVHAAKGLEWPVVVVGDAGRPFPTHGEDAYLEEGALAFRVRDDLEGEEGTPAGCRALATAEARALAEERLRLLYVAATRAEERLLVTCTHAGLTQKGQPHRALGWARTLFDVLGPPLTPGRHDLAVGEGAVRVHAGPVPDLPGPSSPEVAEPPPTDVGVPATPPDVAPLGGTRFVVGVSELMAFARSPAAAYRARLLVPAAAAPLPPRDPDVGVAPGVDPEGLAERRASGADEDEPPALRPPEDRAALGRAVHALLETWAPGAPPDVAGAVAAERGADAPAEAVEAARSMVARFERSGVAARLAAALARGDGVRREAAFHARVRFPGGVRVAGFEALLVKGTIDLWLPEDGEVRLVDFKTNAPSREHPTPAALAEAYAWQMRLYALAAERLLGRDVRAASLLLLDPGWGPEAVDVPVDVSGPALEEARRLCQAFAQAELEDRWPADWRALLSV